MDFARPALIASLAAALAMSASGCELIFSPDRSQIPSSCYPCACEHSSGVGGCSDSCAQSLNGGRPDLCEGAPVSSDCAACVMSSCTADDPAECAPMSTP